MTYHQTEHGCKRISSSYSKITKNGHILNFGYMTPPCDHDPEDSIVIFSHNALAHYRHHHAKFGEKASIVEKILLSRQTFTDFLKINLCIDLE